MRKGHNGEKKRGEKTAKQNRKKKDKTNENSGHTGIANSQQPDRRPLERHTLVPIYFSCMLAICSVLYSVLSKFLSFLELYSVTPHLYHEHVQLLPAGVSLLSGVVPDPRS